MLNLPYFNERNRLVTRSWEPQTHQSTWNQLKQQRNDSTIEWNRAVDGWFYQRENFA